MIPGKWGLRRAVIPTAGDIVADHGLPLAAVRIVHNIVEVIDALCSVVGYVADMGQVQIGEEQVPEGFAVRTDGMGVKPVRGFFIQLLHAHIGDGEIFIPAFFQDTASGIPDH